MNATCTLHGDPRRRGAGLCASHSCSFVIEALMAVPQRLRAIDNRRDESLGDLVSCEAAPAPTHAAAGDGLIRRVGEKTMETHRISWLAECHPDLVHRAMRQGPPA